MPSRRRSAADGAPRTPTGTDVSPPPAATATTAAIEADGGDASATVSASDIARLAGVGRAAVSNWRRRFVDFPQPVGGTSTSPLFALTAVEGWFDRHDRPFRVEVGDRVWQQIRGTVDDPRLGELVGHLGGFLLYHQRDRDAAVGLLGESDVAAARLLGQAIEQATPDLPGGFPTIWEPEWVPVARSAAPAADRDGHGALFEVLGVRYREVHSRQVAETPPAVAELMVGLAGLGERAGELTVLDSACGVGGLLEAARAAGVRRLLGQDIDPTAARITAAGLLLHGADARIVAADSLLADALAGERADAVLCGPPSGQRSWGYEELVDSPWWIYGMPPRSEPELAWVQHCLAHGRSGAPVLVIMPAAAAARPAGRRIRANLLRAGALRAVLGLPPDLFGAGAPPDLWVLRVPGDDVTPDQVLMGLASAEPSAVAKAWSSFTSSAPAGEPASAGEPGGAGLPPGFRQMPVADLLDDEVDLNPRRHVPVYPDSVVEREFPAVREEFLAALSSLSALTSSIPPSDVSSPAEASDSTLEPAAASETAGAAQPAWVTVGELAKGGALTVLTAPLQTRADGGDLPLLTAADVRRGRGASGRTGELPGMLMLRSGDVVCVVAAGRISAEVIDEAGAVLGPKVGLLRVDPGRLDPHFLAGSLRAAGCRAAGGPGVDNEDGASLRSGGTLSRPDLRRVRIPTLTLAAQRELGADFRRLGRLEKSVREAAELGEEIVRVGYLGVAEGRLRVGGDPDSR
ncbi:SAM-dependent methyltransferase [Frankia sp. Mgl5]|uniref:HsdM family class I SAM-dependent methyltransferase n=1 Tax=Frankia sp. Mgl5 TaxID=2933793 RepID=UPI00200F7332|nr:N-6 DNA methylase [Frankia sp. Mgl5]MCK9925867.1 SAM-dependent methyltransferase [Frankia sp. Mgl5]